MFINSREWRIAAPRPLVPTPPATELSPSASFDPVALYRARSQGQPDPAAREQAAGFLRGELDRLRGAPCDLPEAPQGLAFWMASLHRTVQAHYLRYLEERKGGAPRRFFSNRAHALYFLRAVAPTKLVDGAWLYGLLPHYRNPRYSDLVRTYLEELGEGESDKNHVLVYRRLLARYGLDLLDDLPGSLHVQGLVQLALGCNAQDFLPETIGFNLGYEQLPLHLLITAYELNELDLDPYYFTLHVTVDNSDSGHAQRACQAVLDSLPRLDDGGAFWRRVREGSKLGGVGLGTTQVIAGFDNQAEVIRVLARKSDSGSGVHSDYCRVAGRSVNDWLAMPGNIPGFLQALQQAGWIRRGEAASNSRFWKLLQGEGAEMFGVFSRYELQLIHDWIRGTDSADGLAYDAPAGVDGGVRRPGFRAAQRAARSATTGCGVKGESAGAPLDPDLDILRQRLDGSDDAQAVEPLIQAMAPAQHWTPAGLYATRLFAQRWSC